MGAKLPPRFEHDDRASYDVEIISLNELGEAFGRGRRGVVYEMLSEQQLHAMGRQRHRKTALRHLHLTTLRSRLVGSLGSLPGCRNCLIIRYNETSRRRLPVLAGEFASRIRHLVHLTNGEKVTTPLELSCSVMQGRQQMRAQATTLSTNPGTRTVRNWHTNEMSVDERVTTGYL